MEQEYNSSLSKCSGTKIFNDKNLIKIKVLSWTIGLKFT